MVNFNQLFTLAAFGLGMVSAVHIDFMRFQDDKCHWDHHIRKTTDMHDTTCKTFSHNELAFHSFNFTVTKDKEDMTKKDCRIVVFKDRGCKGEAVTYGNMAASEHDCAIVPFDGRSAKLECGKKKQPDVKTLTPMPTPTPSPSSTETLTHHPTVTVTHTHEIQPSSTTEHVTMTVVPKRRIQHCSYVDDHDEWWPSSEQ